MRRLLGACVNQTCSLSCCDAKLVEERCLWSRSAELSAFSMQVILPGCCMTLTVSLWISLG